jgi:hypothetical protein
MGTASTISPEEVFDENGTSDVDFEIALTALLATITLGTAPATEYPSILRFFAYLLLFMTLIRRIAISNTLTDNTEIFESTRIIVLSISYILIFSQVHLITYQFTGVLNSRLHLLLITTSVIIMFTFWILVQEQLFGDLAIYIAILANNAAVTAQGGILSPLSDYLIDSAGRFIYMSKSDHTPDILTELQPESLEKPRNRKHMAIFLIIGAIIFYGLFWVFLAVASGSAAKAFVFFLAAILIQYPVDFLYSRYGAIGFYTERSGIGQFLPVGLGVAATLLLF